MSIINLIDQLKLEIQEDCNKKNQKLAEEIKEKDAILANLKSDVEAYKKQLADLANYKKQLIEHKKDHEIKSKTHNEEKKILSNKIAELTNKLVGAEKDTNHMKDMYIDTNLIITEDPRIDNKPLLEDAMITYAFGARAYVTEQYPGYIWRNGKWFRINSRLKFKPQSNKSIKKYIAGATMTNTDLTFCINDAFVPVLIHGMRYFLLFNYVYGRGSRVYMNKVICYDPAKKSIIPFSLDASVMDSLVYEDKRSFIEKPTNSIELNKWLNKN